MTNPTLLRRLIFGCLFTVLTLIGCSSDPENRKEPKIYSEKEQDDSFRILIIGDSLTEGYGVSAQQAFPSILEKKLNHEFARDTNSAYKVINAGISGSTTSGGASRIDWLLKSKPDFLVVALGGNDGLRGVPIEEIKKNLEKIILAAKIKNIPTLLAGMKIPPNYGIEYTLKFSNLFKDLAKKHKLTLLPFLLEGVGGDPTMNLSDRIHPNPAGHQKIAETVYHTLINYIP